MTTKKPVPAVKKPAAKKPAPTKGPAPAAKKPAPAVKKPAPAAKKPAPAKRAAPVAKKPAPAKRAAPVAKKPAPAKRAAPVAKKPAPAKRAAPVAKKPAPAKRAAPVAEQEPPSAAGPAQELAVEPVSGDSVPVRLEPAVVPEEPQEFVAPTVELAPHLTMSYLEYARETIMDRALPDVRDGLKPSQRRILFVMHELGLRSDQPTKKCARIVGDTLGRYHPHGDTAVYDALVRMAQDFVLRVPLVDGQGNFGDGDDKAAAYRYTEARLTAAAEASLQEIELGTVDFIPNFDKTMQEPIVLPGKFPMLLVNGTLGVACGMATSMPAHNVGEVCQAVVHVAEGWNRREKITVDELLEIIPGPDFPTGGTVFRYHGEGEERKDAIRRAYDRGKGAVVIQAQVDIESRGGGKSQIVITELPYGVKKGRLMKKIAQAVQNGKVTGITDLRDESDHTGMRIMVEVSRQATADDVVQQLLRQGILKKTFAIRNLALVLGEDGVMRPQYLSLRELLVQFISHRLDVIVRRTRYELERKRARLHIVEGLLKALDVLNEIIETIRRSQSPDTAKQNLMRKWKFTDIQAQAILDMQLRRLTALERNKLEEEARELRSRIKYLEGLLASEKKRLQVVVEETTAMGTQFSTPRRTVIIDREDMVAGTTVVTKTDLVAPSQPQVLCLTGDGLQRMDQADDTFKPVRGLSKQPLEAEEILLQRLPVDPKAEILLLSDQGRGWRGQVGFLPRSATPAKLGLGKGEGLVGMAVLSTAAEDTCLVLGTLLGKVKRTKVVDLRLLDRQWGPVLGLADGDRLLFGAVAGPGAHVMFYSAAGQVLRIDGDSVNPQQTDTARGMAGIALREGDRLLGGAVIPDAATVAEQWWAVVVSQQGYIHRVGLAAFPVQGRGAGGVRCLRPSKSGGEVAAIAVGCGEVVDVLLDDGRRHRLFQKDLPATTIRDALGNQVVKLGKAQVRGVVLLAAKG